MIIYGCIIIALIVAAFLWFKFKKQVVWWEYLLLLIPIPLVLGIKLLVKDAQITFAEYHGGDVIAVYEEEPANAWVEKTCTERYWCGTDEDGMAKYCTRTYSCPEQEDYSPSWWCKTSNGETISITEAQHDNWSKRFGNNKTAIQKTRNHAPNDRCVGSSKTKFKGKTVGAYSYTYKTIWDGNYSTSIPITSEHSYKNRIKASDLSDFKMEKVDEETANKMGLYDYPKLTNNFNFPTVLGIKDKNIQKKFQKINGYIGPKKHARLWVLVHYWPDKTIGKVQENYWARGNQNEFVLNIGVDNDNNIIWSYVFSWMKPKGDNERPVLFSDVENYIMSKEVMNDDTWDELAVYLKGELGTKFEINEIEHFDRVTVDPPTWAIILCYILTLIISAIVSVIVIRNDITN